MQKTKSTARSKASKPGKAPPRPILAGLQARELACHVVAAVLDKGRTLDEALGTAMERAEAQDLSAKDKAFARSICTTVLRRQGQLEAIVGAFIERPLPDQRGNLTPILLSAAAQLVFLDVPPHAVINLAVEQVRRDRRAQRFDKLSNAVLRRVSERGAEIASTQDAARLNTPDWLWQRWAAAYGEAAAREIATASLREAPLDISVKDNSAGPHWAEQLGGTLLPSGSIRLAAGGRIEELPGFAEGAWWVQDAAAALPAKLFGNVEGQRIADLCAAPGGKTAELAAAGARVTAVDSSGQRLARLKANLERLQLEAQVIHADASDWQPSEPFDGVLLDAPCSATGTIRRHPDILRLKQPGDIDRLGELQARLLQNAARMVKPGGLLVYCTCSLEPEEGAHQVEKLLARGSFERVPIAADEIGADPGWISPAGDLRTLPFHLPQSAEGMSGMDGFYAARLRRKN